MTSLSRGDGHNWQPCTHHSHTRQHRPHATESHRLVVGLFGIHQQLTFDSLKNSILLQDY